MKRTTKTIYCGCLLVLILMGSSDLYASPLKDLAAPNPAIRKFGATRQLYKCSQEISFKYSTTWWGRVGDKILSFLKPNMWNGKPVTAQVRIFLNDDGSVKKAMNRGSSGSLKLDNAVIEAVHKAAPFKEAAGSRNKDYKKNGVIFGFEFTGKSVELVDKYHDRCHAVNKY